MAYDYRCTYCGKLLNQHTVNIQMLPVLGETAEKEFKHFSFYVTAEEFHNMLAEGTPVDDGYTRCKIPFGRYMEYMADCHNRNDSRLKEITYEQLELFAKEDYEFEQPLEDDIFGDDDESFSTKTAHSLAHHAPKKSEEEVRRKELEDLFIGIFKIYDWEAQDKRKCRKLLSDLRKETAPIKNAFDKNSVLEFDIALRDDLEDDKGDRIFCGYKLRNPKTRLLRFHDQARVCSNPLCRQPVFEFAGSAEHTCVAIVGDQNSEKTDTIVALASYAERACTGGGVKGDPIWEGVPGIPGIDECRIICRSKRFKRDLERYSNGLRSQKTGFGKGDGFSVTLRITPRNSTKYKLLTLTDLPGELMGLRLDNNINYMYNDFPHSISCDAYILNYDSRPWAINTRQNLTVAMEKFLKENRLVREERGENSFGIKRYVPIILVFNRWYEPEDLNHVHPDGENIGNYDRISAMHVFHREMCEIARNPKFNDMYEGLKNGFVTQHSYQTAIRVANFGYQAFDRDYIPGEPVERYPKPRNIEKLMFWLMAVTGCVPCSAEYIPDPNDPEIRHRTENYTLNRIQYRTEPPQGKTAAEKLDEAAIRCYLFSNPSKEDIALLEKYL